MSEIRENRITGEWVIIAPERAKRGSNFVPSCGARRDCVLPVELSFLPWAMRLRPQKNDFALMERMVAGFYARS